MVFLKILFLFFCLKPGFSFTDKDNYSKTDKFPVTLKKSSLSKAIEQEKIVSESESTFARKGGVFSNSQSSSLGENAEHKSTFSTESNQDLRERMKESLTDQHNSSIDHLQAVLADRAGDSSRFHTAPLLYNQGLDALSLGDTDKALWIFERALYQYLYFPALKALKSMKSEIELSPIIWHFGIVIYAIASLFLIWVLMIRKTSFKSRLRIVFIWSLALSGVFISGLFSLRPRGRVIKAIELKNAPLEQAIQIGAIEKGQAFVTLKMEGEWIKIKTTKNQRGWVLRENLFFTLQ